MGNPKRQPVLAFLTHISWGVCIFASPRARELTRFVLCYDDPLVVLLSILLGIDGSNVFVSSPATVVFL